MATQKTEYLYNKTEQVAKTVTDLVNSRIESETIMEYNAQGRMAKITIMTYVDGSLAKIVTQEYEYDSSGIKVKQTETVDADADGTIDSGKSTEYLNVKQNHTGYSQVLEEYLSEDGNPVKVTTYTIGHDVLTQANALYGILTLLADGHGSTRAVADHSGAVLQQYSYDAYGNVHGFNPSEAMTNLLYSGEQFNPVSGLQYLRARWYNPQTGTFNRLDPYSGNRESPLSFHKYAYAHMNPIMIADPTGNMGFPAFIGIMTALGTIAGAAIGIYKALTNNTSVLTGAIYGGLWGFTVGALTGIGVSVIAAMLGAAGIGFSAAGISSSVNWLESNLDKMTHILQGKHNWYKIVNTVSTAGLARNDPMLSTIYNNQIVPIMRLVVDTCKNPLIQNLPGGVIKHFYTVMHSGQTITVEVTTVNNVKTVVNAYVK